MGRAKQIMLEMKLPNLKINGSQNVTALTSDTFVVVTFLQIDSTRFVATVMSSGTAEKIC